MMKRRSLVFKLAAALIIAGMASYGFYYYFWSPYQYIVPTGIAEFNYDRDAANIHQMFKRDWYWLVEGTPESYDADYMLKNRSRYQDPAMHGTLHIKVLREDEKLVGFVAYYLQNFYVGMILFLDVNPEFRGKGYAPQLMNYALDHLKQLGARQARLVTRTSNEAAQSVYRKTGFSKVSEQDGFVYFAKNL